MLITSFVELTPAQRLVLEAFDSIEVRTALLKPSVVATIKTFQAQDIKVTIDANGIIENVDLQ
jgi:hypothetical protein